MGFPATVSVKTNCYDVTWAYNVSAHDVLLLNPGCAAARPGGSLRLPCYPPGGLRGLAPTYFGGSVAYLEVRRRAGNEAGRKWGEAETRLLKCSLGRAPPSCITSPPVACPTLLPRLQFSGGNERPGFSGLAGAMAASGTNDHIPNQNDFDSSYNGSLALAADGTFAVVEPVYLFVFTEAAFQVHSSAGWHHCLQTGSFGAGLKAARACLDTRGSPDSTCVPSRGRLLLQVSVVVITAGDAMRNASIYIGSDSSSVQANQLVAVSAVARLHACLWPPCSVHHCFRHASQAASCPRPMTRRRASTSAPGRR